ncbi:TraR/DksA C4-type zinc finger protein [Vibrio tritonius]|uniref:TraR/DksA C4-type zinc finger protein n=1 Tax=Vibrio tritonius TaxID=1435069 RepID=UPI00315D0D1A
MDFCDDASSTETQFQKMALARQLSGTKPVTTPSQTHCLECGEPIPKARQLAIPGCLFCVTCQAQRE